MISLFLSKAFYLQVDEDLLLPALVVTQDTALVRIKKKNRILNYDELISELLKEKLKYKETEISRATWQANDLQQLKLCVIPKRHNG